MVSKGYGVSVSDVAIIAAIAGAGYLAYKWYNSDIVKGVGAGVGGLGTGIGQIGTTTGTAYQSTVGETAETYKSVQDAIQRLVSKIGSSGGSSTTTARDLINEVTSAKPVTKVETQVQTAYNIPTVKVTSASGKSSTIIAAPNTYYSKLGVGFNAAGQGYSSQYAGNKATSGAPSGASVAALIRANPKFN